MKRVGPYKAIAALLLVLFFIVFWRRFLTLWGMPHGLVFGWAPALIAASIAALLWPLLAALVLVVGFVAMCA